MTIRIGINGFGRIGRDLLRCLLTQPERDIEVVAVNDLAAPATLGHLLAHDSTYGALPYPVTARDDHLEVAGGRVRVLSSPEPDELPWGELGVDLVIEATGRFRTRDAAAAHLEGGARKVVITAPGKSVDATIVMGVNERTYRPATDHVVSNASCTTNCVAPMVLVLHQAFGIRRGLMTTIHSYTNDQALLDSPHRDLRRARSAAVNLVPTSTGAARAIGDVIPDLAGKLDGVAVRAPVEVGSLTDLAVELDTPATVDDVNAAFAAAAEGALKGVLRYSEEPLVSRDIIGDPASCVFDAELTTVTGILVKAFGWYDNERGYVMRTLDLVELMARER